MNHPILRLLRKLVSEFAKIYLRLQKLSLRFQQLNVSTAGFHFTFNTSLDAA
jgi:hypothetical protein